MNLKEYLASPPVLCKPLVGTPLRLYFAVTERAVSAVLAQDQDQAQKPIYFVSKVLQGLKVRYQALEKAALVVVFSARRLRHYFHSFTVLMMTNLPIQKVLKKSDVTYPENLSLILWSSSRRKQHELRGTIFVGYFRWTDRLTSRVAVLESF